MKQEVDRKMIQRWHLTDLHFCCRYDVETGIATVYHFAQNSIRQFVPPSTLLFLIWLCVIITFFVCKLSVKNKTLSSKPWVRLQLLRGDWAFPHDLNAASDDESRSPAADSQVWSAAGRHSDRGGHLVDSTGTESTRSPRGSVSMTDRAPSSPEWPE